MLFPRKPHRTATLPGGGTPMNLEDMATGYPVLVARMTREQREEAVTRVRAACDRGLLPGNVLYPIVCLDPDLSIVSTAALDLATYSGGGVDGMGGVRLVLEWLEGCDSGRDDGRFGDLASLLYRMPLRLRYSKVLEVRRLFDGYDSVRVETISEEAIPAFARKYAARLYALEKSEKAPKVMSTVMRSWGLSPRARRGDQFLPEQ